MDKEEFEAWKTSQSTQWVLARLAAKAEQVRTELQHQLFHSTGHTAEQWADLQARAGHDVGVADGLNFVVELQFEEIHDAE
jgi:hypothetical protein